MTAEMFRSLEPCAPNEQTLDGLAALSQFCRFSVDGNALGADFIARLFVLIARDSRRGSDFQFVLR